ncbi:hypothetical protein [Maribacter forsetii]|uniref:hypothetical protein n=1 Tax=Maribacter forsetii TaxID=444515 RepID=UPI000ADC6F7C|nr:hypothetical protein [Maribacter forsetii]
MLKEKNHTIRQIKTLLIAVLMIAVIGEMIFFPSTANLFGCIMAMIALTVFLLFFNERFIRLYPFVFCIYLSMFMYRFLPLIATLIENKPITFGFERPYETFFYEIVLFLVSSLAVYLACPINIHKPKNNIIKEGLYKLKFFEITPAILWSMGFIGLLSMIYNISKGDAQIGDTSGRFIAGLTYLMFAPVCLFFPFLLKVNYTKTKYVFLYTAFIILINLASNKRHLIITPIGTIGILFILQLIFKNIRITQIISPIKIMVVGVFIFLGLNLLNTVSTAMLYTRQTLLYTEELRDNADKMETFAFTMETLQNEQLMQRLKDNKNENIHGNSTITYAQGWTEQYVDNFLLARYANMRITDETIYYAHKRGFSNVAMQESLINSILYLLPSPILNFFGIRLDKTEMDYSRGDFLHGTGYGNYVVTSHVGDGLATFGHWYFIVQLAVYFLMFKTINCFSYYTSQGILYAPFAVMDVFGFLGRFRNAQGIFGDLGFLIRGFLQGVITYLIIYHIIRFVLKMINPIYVHNELSTEVENQKTDKMNYSSL